MIMRSKPGRFEKEIGKPFDEIGVDEAVETSKFERP